MQKVYVTEGWGEIEANDPLWQKPEKNRWKKKKISKHFSKILMSYSCWVAAKLCNDTKSYFKP